MNKIISKIGKTLIALSLIINTGVVTAAPEKPSGEGGGGNSSSSSNVSYSGANKITSDTTNEGSSYSSTTGGQNALLVSGGSSTLKNLNVTKSGDTSDENSDFYGNNAGILVYNKASLNISGGSITTNGGHANAVFAYGTGKINIEGTTIKTTANNSGGIMVTGGGTISAKNLNIETAGGSSAAIRSDRGGGTITVDKGTYKTTGKGSPAIYSTADITVNNADLISTASEGVVIEGKNSVTLNNVNLTDTNNTLNGQSTTYKNIFLYQSMSGDADEGTSSFTAKDSTITTNKGDTIYVTNTTSVVNLENNKIVNNDNGDFLRAEAAAWGSSGSNGGNVTLNMTNQKATGDITIDNISTLSMKMTNGSMYKGTINSDKTAKKISLNLSSDSVVILTGDSYITSLTNEVSDNSNIYLNGYNLYVNGTKVNGNTSTPPSMDEEDTNVVDTNKKVEKEESNILKYAIPAAIVIAAIGTITIVFIMKRIKNKKLKGVID